jgi:adenosylcobinamide kinase/adenosylcobinamide-phosphate guanylyltransferase
MDLLLTGTGPASGFPIPGCPCATCRSATSAARPAAGSARPARRPAELRIGDYRVDVHSVLHAPDGTAHRPALGDRLELPGIVLQALAGNNAGLLIRAGDDPAVLWAPQAGRLPGATSAALAEAGLGTVILGPAPELDPDEPGGTPGPIESALTLARLRAVGAVGAQTACLLVGLGHRQGPADRLAVCLEHWRVQAPEDGARLVPGRPGDLDGLAVGGRTLVLGGSASGKSGLAEDLLAAEPEVLYTATGPVVDLRTAPDAEWAQRVQRHRERRPAWWRTEETHLVAALLAKNEQPVLLDSVGTWLTGVLDRAGAWSDTDGWRDRVTVETDALVQAWRARRDPLVAVSDEVGLGVVPATSAGRLFRDELGRLNRRLADESEQVLVVMAGRLLGVVGGLDSPGVSGIGRGPQ